MAREIGIERGVGGNFQIGIAREFGGKDRRMTDGIGRKRRAGRASLRAQLSACPQDGDTGLVSSSGNQSRTQAIDRQSIVSGPGADIFVGNELGIRLSSTVERRGAREDKNAVGLEIGIRDRSRIVPTERHIPPVEPVVVGVVVGESRGFARHGRRRGYFVDASAERDDIRCHVLAIQIERVRSERERSIPDGRIGGNVREDAAGTDKSAVSEASAPSDFHLVRSVFAATNGNRSVVRGNVPRTDGRRNGERRRHGVLDDGYRGGTDVSSGIPDAGIHGVASFDKT